MTTNTKTINFLQLRIAPPEITTAKPEEEKVVVSQPPVQAPIPAPVQADTSPPVVVVQAPPAAAEAVSIEEKRPSVQKIVIESGVDPIALKRIQWRLSNLEKFEESVGAALEEIKETLARMESTRAELDEMRKGYVTVEKTMHELAALYDLISANINPFIDIEQEQAAISTQIKKKKLGMVRPSTPDFKRADTAPIPATPEEDLTPETWIVRWSEFLLERIPRNKISGLLQHYIDIGWLDEEIKNKVEQCLKGMDEISLGIRPPEPEPEEEKGKPDWWKLPIDDHVKSLQFIEKIRGFKVEEVPAAKAGK